MDRDASPQRRRGDPRGHLIEDPMDGLVTSRSEDGSAHDLLGVRVDEDLYNPCVSPFSIARETRDIGRRPISSGRPVFRASRSVSPTRPSGGSM